MYLTVLSVFVVVICGVISVEQLTSAGDATAVDTLLTQFSVVKGINSIPVCAVNTQSLLTVVAESVEFCAYKCHHWQRLSSCDGFNYRVINKACELFAGDQTIFDFVTGCRYFTVCIV
jgi:hypothetical protein